MQLRAKRVVLGADIDLEREVVKRGACLKGKEKGRLNKARGKKALIILKDVLPCIVYKARRDGDRERR